MRMPLASETQGPSFQQHMDRTIRYCHAAFAWVDDIAICSRNHEEHVGHVRQVLDLQTLQENRLVINSEKCVWGVPELDYLSHKILAVHAATSFPRGCHPGFSLVPLSQGVTRRCRLSFLPNSVLVYRVQMQGGGDCGVSANECNWAHHVTWSPNKLCRSTSISNLCSLIKELQAFLGMVGDGCHFLGLTNWVDFSTYDTQISSLAGVTV